MCLSTGRPYGVRRVQILTTPETESPKKAWFIQSGLCDLAAGKGFFNSLALIYTQISGGFKTVWKEDKGGGQILNGQRKGDGEGFLQEGEGLFGLYIPILILRWI